MNWQINLKIRLSILIIMMGILGPCISTVGDTTGSGLFEPGREYHVITDNEKIGLKCFNLYVPLDYTDDRDWPIIFRFKGRNKKYNPIICRVGRQLTCDRGAIVVGMAYLEYEQRNRTIAQYRSYIKREIKSIHEVQKCVAKHLRIDNYRMFISGSSAGGWHATNLLELRSQPWAGAMVFVAGMHPNASLLTNDKSIEGFYGLPVFFGSSPEGSHGANHKWALRGADEYKRRGAIVTFETYANDSSLVSNAMLRDWVRTYVLDDKTDTIKEKREKSLLLAPKKLSEMDNVPIIKEQIAKTLNKPANQLTEADLLEVTELSLVGLYISDISYLANLKNLRSLDISFTYANNLDPLASCKELRTLNISDILTDDITPLKNMPKLESLTMWNLWLDRKQVDELNENLPDLKVIDYLWDLYEKDSIGRILPKLRVKID